MEKTIKYNHEGLGLDNDMEPAVESLGTMDELKRDLKPRHINMIAIAGMIVSRSRSYPSSP